MRTSALALLLLMASCGQGGQVENRPGPAGNQAGVGPQIGPGAAVTITLAATGPDRCAVSWNGEAIPAAQVADRAFNTIRAAVDALGGAGNLRPEDLPPMTVDAPAELSFACADGVLAALQRGAVPSVRVRSGSSRGPVLAEFMVEGMPPPPIVNVVRVGAAGEVTWNGAPITAAALAERVRPSPAGHGVIELRPSRETSFGPFYETLRIVSQPDSRPILILPSAEAGAGPQAPAAPPPPPPPPPPPGGG